MKQLSSPNIKDLLTESKVYMVKYLSRKISAKLRQILVRTDRTIEVNKKFIIWLLVHFLQLSLFKILVSYWDAALSLKLGFISTQVKHSFVICLLGKICKATLMFKNCQLFIICKKNPVALLYCIQTNP